MIEKIVKTLDLKILAEKSDPTCVSIFMNTHKIKNERPKDHLIFKNFVDTADHILKDKGVKPPDREELLRPARQLLEDTLFWAYLSRGLAVYLSPGWHAVYKLPIPVGNRAFINEQFNVEPLISYFDKSNRFFLLSLDQHGCKFYQGTVDGISELHLEGLEKAHQVIDLVEPEKQLQLHSTAKGGSRSAFHGHSESEHHKTRIKEYFTAIDSVIKEELKREKAPLILAGVDYLHPVYKEVNSYKHLLNDGITGNTKDMDEDSLREKALQVTSSVLSAHKNDAIEHYGKAKHSGLVVDGPSNCAVAASEGKVELLLCQSSSIATELQSRVENQITLDDQEEFEVGKAAVNVLIQGGEIVFLKESELPLSNQAEAVLKYSDKS